MTRPSPSWLWFAALLTGCPIASTSDLDAAGPACAHASDCASGTTCIAGACTPSVPCTSSRTCPGLVCAVALGVCAECQTNADCPVATTCRVGVCERADTPTDASTDAFAASDAFADLDTGLDSGLARDVGTDTASDVGPDAASWRWELLSTSGGVHYPGYSDYTPASGAGAFYASSSDTTPSFALFEPIGGGRWSDRPSTTSTLGNPAYFAGPAWVGDALVLIVGGRVFHYDIASTTWTVPLTMAATTSWAQHAHDDAGRVYVVTTDDRMATYEVATNTLSYQPFGMSPPATGPRLAWDATTRLLYVVPNFSISDMYSFDPATGMTHVLPALPASRVTPTFCGDRNGHLFAAGENNGTEMWEYDVALAHWSLLPGLPFDHDANGACTVTDDGWLYVTDNGTNLARLRLR